MAGNEGPVEHAYALDRRDFLGRSILASAAIAVSGNVLIHTSEAWGLEAQGLQPETIRTLIKLARDIYPHDSLSDKYYAIAVKPYDEKAAKDPANKALIETGVSTLDSLAMAQHKVPYIGIGWESPRVAILQMVEGSPFFQMVRSGLVVSLYNQKDVWPIFGYEGESASKGGYIRRGFNDLAWL